MGEPMDATGRVEATGALDATGRVEALSLALAHEPVATEQRVAGAPTTGLESLGTFAGAEVGVWEMTPGTMTDVEADEIFVVIAGRATIEFPTTGRVMAVAPGDVVRLTAGDETVWTVTETLRKVWVAG